MLLRDILTYLASSESILIDGTHAAADHSKQHSTSQIKPVYKAPSNLLQFHSTDATFTPLYNHTSPFESMTLLDDWFSQTGANTPCKFLLRLSAPSTIVFLLLAVILVQYQTFVFKSTFNHASPTHCNSPLGVDYDEPRADRLICTSLNHAQALSDHSLC